MVLSHGDKSSISDKPVAMTREVPQQHLDLPAAPARETKYPAFAQPALPLRRLSSGLV